METKNGSQLELYIVWSVLEAVPKEVFLINEWIPSHVEDTLLQVNYIKQIYIYI